MQPVILFVVAFLTAVRAIIPMPCANFWNLTNRECCPVPDIGGNPGLCGVNFGRGSCEPVSIPESDFNSSETDIRKKWPIQYFSSVCKCNEKYGGFDCGECSYGYNDGRDCEEKTILPRVSVFSMNENDWKRYHWALRSVKENSSRYMVSISNFTTDIQELVESLVHPNTYNLFIWLHHLVAKDNDFTLSKNLATVL